MRLNKFIASRLSISRRKADTLIKEGVVKIEDNKGELSDDVADDATVTIAGKLLPAAKSVNLYMFNKPIGYVCSHRGQGSKTIYDLLPKSLQHLNSVGRLDKDTSGLLLLTNDGYLHNKLAHPSFEKHKIYKVKLDKNLSKDDIAHLRSGIMLKDGLSKLQIEDKQTYILVTMHEGKNRQIRRTFAKLSYTVTELHRTSFGPYNLSGLKSGEFTEVKK